MPIRLTQTGPCASVSGMNSAAKVFDIHQRDDLSFPKSLGEFQKLFPDDAACAAYLERVRWHGSFVCPNCREQGEPFRIATRPTTLQCRKCRRQTGLMRGTVMQ